MSTNRNACHDLILRSAICFTTVFTGLRIVSHRMSFPESQNIINKLKGQKVRIPNLYAVLEGWPSKVNPHIDTIGKLIDQVLER